MRAVRWHGRRDLRYEEVEDAPPPGPGEVRVAVEWCGICGTDVEEYLHGPLVIAAEPHPLTGVAAPVTIGHEVSGRVLDSGAGVDLEPGTLVALDGMIHCGRCDPCRRHQVNRCVRWAHIGMSHAGGLAERLTVPAYMAVPAPVDVDAAALALAEPFAVAVRAVRRAALAPAARVVVLGGGTIGLAAAQVAAAAGAAEVVVVEPNRWRRDLAGRVGVEAVASAADVEPSRADTLVECTGSAAAVPGALSLVAAGGRVVLVGLPVEHASLDLLDVVLREVEIVGSVGHVYDQDLTAAVGLITRGHVHALGLVTHRVPLAHAVVDGVERLADRDRAAETLKVLISPN